MSQPFSPLKNISLWDTTSFFSLNFLFWIKFERRRQMKFVFPRAPFRRIKNARAISTARQKATISSQSRMNTAMLLHAWGRVSCLISTRIGLFCLVLKDKSPRSIGNVSHFPTHKKRYNIDYLASSGPSTGCSIVTHFACSCWALAID